MNMISGIKCERLSEEKLSNGNVRYRYDCERCRRVTENGEMSPIFSSYCYAAVLSHLSKEHRDEWLVFAATTNKGKLIKYQKDLTNLRLDDIVIDSNLFNYFHQIQLDKKQTINNPPQYDDDDDDGNVFDEMTSDDLNNCFDLFEMADEMTKKKEKIIEKKFKFNHKRNEKKIDILSQNLQLIKRDGWREDASKICRLCFKLTRNDIFHHYLFHTDEKPFICNICPFKTNILRELNNHLTKTHSNSIQSNEQLINNYNSFEYFKIERNERENDNESIVIYYDCYGEKIEGEWKLENDNDLLKFYRQQLITLNRSVVMRDEDKLTQQQFLYRCELCKKRFNLFIDQLYHMWEKHIYPKEKENIFKYLEDEENQMVYLGDSTHPIPFICPLCCHGPIMENDSIWTHLHEHTKEIMFRCHICQSTIPHPDAMFSHFFQSHPQISTNNIRNYLISFSNYFS
ncbi:hypothetical protein SNEBB_010853 [Seison nebaliae]|nr:hypothetical protein SNEBB_010853 [Seison nebaliae]